MRRAVVALLLPVLAACGPPTAGTTSSAASASPSPSASALPAGYPAEAFRVAFPMLFYGSGGGAPLELPACTPTQVVAKAATIRTSDGVDGVIKVDGPHCSLDIRQGPTYLLDQGGRQLGISLHPEPPAENPPTSRRGDKTLAVGHALWGFAIDGSWCGAAPSSVVLQLTTDATTAAVTDIKAPITGPMPACRGESNAELRPGVVGSEASDDGPAEAVLPAPQAWLALRVALHVDTVAHGTVLSGLTATISNPTGSPIALAPCPSYEMIVSVGGGDIVTDGAFGCTAATVVAAGGSATFPVASQALGRSGLTGIVAGAPVKIQLAIVGAPTANAEARIG